MGILRLIELAITVSFAAPAAILGIQRIMDGNLIGWGFLALAALFLGMNLLVETPADIIESKFNSVFGFFTKDPKN